MKKILTTIIKIITIILITYLVIFFIQNIYIKNKIKEYTNSFEYNVENVLDNDVVRCNYNIFNPYFADIQKEERNWGIKHSIYFRGGDIPFFKITKENWQDYHIGSTDIKNSTYPQILKMVKEDCKQFQESISYKKEDEDKIRWVYGKYTPPKPKTKEELEKERLEEEEYQRKIEEEGYKEEIDLIELLQLEVAE